MHIYINPLNLYIPLTIAIGKARQSTGSLTLYIRKLDHFLIRLDSGLQYVW